MDLRRLGRLLCGLALLGVWSSGPARAQSAESSAVERGAYVFAAAGCAECHTDRKNHGRPLAGGRALKTPFGTFYTPNITPDPVYGIGKWSDADFHRALRDGIGPDGTHYFPVFPFPSYTGMTDDDIAALKAYLFSVAPVAQSNKLHEINFPFGFRPLMAMWDAFYLRPGPLRPDPARTPAWNRGAYLVRALGHCGECHTPRNPLGAPDLDLLLAGTSQGPEGGVVPNITPDKDSGIGGWSAVDITYLLETGLKPDGDDVGAAMGEVVDASTSRLTAEDRAAIATYLKSLPPIHHVVRKAKSGS